ncbi:MAG: PAS domain S-box protein [Cyclobacteriaceae bacterium]|nr:PAS domain S-box protein [Cyclobacteriaceae bacterium]
MNHSHLFKAAFELAPDATIISDSSGEIVMVNAKTEWLLGYSKEELIGNKIEILVPQSARNRHIQHRQKYNTEKSPRQMGSYMDLYAVKKDGSQIPVDISLNYVELDGHRLILSSIRDITRNKDLLKKLALSEKRLNEAQSLAKIGNWEMDMETKELYWSDQVYEILGVEQTAQPPEFELFRARVHPDDREEVTRQFEKQITHKTQVDLVHRLLMPNGEIKYVHQRGDINVVNKNKISRSIGTITDISEQKDIENKLRISIHKVESANKELEQFAFIASHDLQEPLRTLESFIELVSNDPRHKSIKYLHHITSACHHMNRLVKGLLDYTRIGKNMTKSPVDLNHVLEEVIDMQKEEILIANLEISIEKLPTLTVNRDLISLLFHHLINNAVKFRNKDTDASLEIGTGYQKGQWLFMFRDNGIGIPKKFHEKIFIIFQRLHNRSDIDGTGIGLSHCKKIIDEHGGDIWVESEPDKGSAFYFTLPA